MIYDEDKGKPLEQTPQGHMIPEMGPCKKCKGKVKYTWSEIVGNWCYIATYKCEQCGEEGKRGYDPNMELNLKLWGYVEPVKCKICRSELYQANAKKSGKRFESCPKQCKGSFRWLE